MFLAPDHGIFGRLKDAARTALAWDSIVDDVKEGKLNIDLLQKNQAEKALKSAGDMLPRAVSECYKWLLCLVHEVTTDPKPAVEAFALTTTGGSLGAEIKRVCLDNELVIQTWSPILLRTMLQELYWEGGQSAASASGFFEDTLRYLYLPRFKDRDVLHRAIRTGAARRDFFGTVYGRDSEAFEGFQFGSGDVVFDDTLLLIEPAAAKAYEDTHQPPLEVPGTGGDTTNARSLELKNADWE